MFIDNFLNNITMYRLMLYYLIALVLLALALSLFGLLPFTAIDLALNTIFLIAVCWLTNRIFANTFEVITNLESVYITALILALIITPSFSLEQLLFLGWAGVLAMSSKYILAIHRKHLFNPVAIAVFLTAICLNQSATWWAGSSVMLPVVVIGGLLVVRKVRRFKMVLSFLATALAAIISIGLTKGTTPVASFERAVLDSPLIFFAFVMLTEPLTTPPTKWLQMTYAAIVGLLFAPQVHLGALYTTPEIALLVGNVFSYAVSPKQKLMLTLKEKIALSPDLYDFIFTTNQAFKFTAGQYLEWTLALPKQDSRGNRRYFTIASSPTEDTIRLGIKTYPQPSAFKQSLLQLKPGDKVIAGQLAGDFTLPTDPDKKLVFIAGGIGITPYRSMLKFLVDTKQKRQITLMYSTNDAKEAVYTDVFNQAAHDLGIKTVITITDPTKVPANWTGKSGLIDAAMITAEVPNFKERTFYLSGPRGMIVAFEKTLHQMGVPSTQIKTDYFPGFA